jgi:hydroxyacid-oxoacid transhydrogenase
MMKTVVKPKYLSTRQFGGCSACLFENTVGFSKQLEYGFEIQPTHIKFGHGIIKELGYDAIEKRGFKRIALLTDKHLVGKYPYEAAMESLKQYQKLHSGVSITVYDSVTVEPTDDSCKEAVKFAIDGKFDSFISVGGGSVMDTAKIANLYSTYPTNNFLKYVNAPIGEASVPPGPLKPHIAIPTTSGTGSETTGFAIFDLLSMKTKTGIGHKSLIPTVALVDPLVTTSLSPLIVACSGFDTLAHAMESYTAISYNKKTKTGLERPLHQGSNPMSDFGCLRALDLTAKYLLRAVKDSSDMEAREMMLFASTLAGTAMGNAGVHLCHGMSYPVSALVKDFKPDPSQGYPDEPIIPHGMSVILHAPTVFKFLSSSCSTRLMEMAKVMSLDLRDVDKKDAGLLVSQEIIRLMKATGMPSGLEKVGFHQNDIKQLVPLAFAQKRVINNAPIPISESDLSTMYHGALSYWK